MPQACMPTGTLPTTEGSRLSTIRFVFSYPNRYTWSNRESTAIASAEAAFTVVVEFVVPSITVIRLLKVFDT